MVPIVCVVGTSGVGKTHVMKGLVAELKKRGYRVATVKHSPHHIDLDVEGKDSWEHARAGSDAAVVSSPDKVALIRKVDHDHTLAELSRIVGVDFDIILGEGFKKAEALKIEVHRKDLGRDLTCTPEELLAVATDEQLQGDVPQYALDDAAGLVDLIEQRCLRDVRERDTVHLYVNAAPVPLNEFVRGIFSNVLFGMVSSLKRVPEATGIDISVRRKSTE
jgi:molybdopterin-guanine dinucleotide biosynthesis protein B